MIAVLITKVATPFVFVDKLSSLISFLRRYHLHRIFEIFMRCMTLKVEGTAFGSGRRSYSTSIIRMGERALGEKGKVRSLWISKRRFSCRTLAYGRGVLIFVSKVYVKFM